MIVYKNTKLTTFWLILFALTTYIRKNPQCQQLLIEIVGPESISKQFYEQDPCSQFVVYKRTLALIYGTRQNLESDFY